MVDQVLSPSKESANAVLFMRDLLTMMGDKKLADKSAKGLIEAAERVEEAFESRAAMAKTKQLLHEAEVAVDAARREADAIAVDAKRKNEWRWQELEKAKSAFAGSLAKNETSKKTLADKAHRV